MRNTVAVTLALIAVCVLPAGAQERGAHLGVNIGLTAHSDYAASVHATAAPLRCYTTSAIPECAPVPVEASVTAFSPSIGGQDDGVVTNIEATISAVGDAQDGYVEVALDGPLLDGREPLTIRAVLNPDEYPAGHEFGNPWPRFRHFLGHLEFYRGATLVHRVENYYVGFDGLSYSPSVLDVHYHTWGGGAPQPGNLGVLRYNLAAGDATTKFYFGVPEDKQNDLWNCTGAEQVWPLSADPRMRQVAFSPCRSRVDAVEAKEQAARDLLAAAAGVLDNDLGPRRYGERVVLACDGCASIGDQEFRAMLAASDVAVERARSPAFDVLRLEHRGFAVAESFSVVFMRGLPDGAWEPLYGETYHHYGYGVSWVSFPPNGNASLGLGVTCESDVDPWPRRCEAVVDLNDRRLQILDNR